MDEEPGIPHQERDSYSEYSSGGSQKFPGEKELPDTHSSTTSRAALTRCEKRLKYKHLPRNESSAGEGQREKGQEKQGNATDCEVSPWPGCVSENSKTSLVEITGSAQHEGRVRSTILGDFGGSSTM